MARKKTYASVMDDMSKKLSNYENRLSQAQKQGDAVGIQDYTRRIDRLKMGMDTLFNTQEAGKAEKMGHGGHSKWKIKYADGGLTQAAYAEYKFLNAMLPQQRSPEDNARMQQLQTAVDAASQMGWQEEFGFNPDGSMAGPALPSAEVATAAPPAEPYTGPSITPDEALRRMQPSFNQGPGNPVYTSEDLGAPATPAPTQPATTDIPRIAEPQNIDYLNYLQATTPVNAFIEQTGGPAPSTPPVASPPATTVGTAPTPMATAPAQAPVQPRSNAPVPTLQTRSAEETPVEETQADPNSGFNIDFGNPEIGTYSTPEPQANISGFFDQMAGKQNPLAQYGQFLPDIYSAVQMNRMQGPEAMPEQVMARMNTDVNYNPVYAQARQNVAAQEASIDRNVTNPVVRAALKRSARNEMQTQMGNTMTNELNQERQLQNQYAQNIAQNQNINQQIAFQNQQNQLNFENDRKAANARLAQQAGMKLGQIYGENQNRALDQQRLGLSALMYDGDLMQRLQQNFGNLFNS